MTPISTNTLGFFLDLDSSKFKDAFKDAQKTYSSFTKVLTKDNDLLLDRAQKTIDVLGKAGAAFTETSKKAIKEYAVLLGSLQRQAQARPIKQPVEFVFTSSSSRVMSDAIGAAVARVLGRGVITLTPGRGEAGNVTGKARNDRGQYTAGPRAEQTFSGSFKFPTTKTQKFNTGGMVQPVAGVPQAGDQLPIWASVGETIDPAGVRNKMANDLATIRNVSTRDHEGQKGIKEEIKGLPDALFKASVLAYNVTATSNRAVTAHEAGMRIDPHDLAAQQMQIAQARAHLTKSLEEQSALNPDRVAKLLPLYAKIRKELDGVDKELVSISTHSHGAFGEERLHDKIAGILKLDPIKFLAASRAVRMFSNVAHQVSQRLLGGYAGSAIAAGTMAGQQNGQYDATALGRLLSGAGRGVNVHEAMAAAQALHAAGFGTASQFGSLGRTVAQVSAAGGVGAGTSAALSQTLRAGAGFSESAVESQLVHTFGAGRGYGLNQEQNFAAAQSAQRAAISTIRRNPKLASSLTQVTAAITAATGSADVGGMVGQVIGAATSMDQQSLRMCSIIGVDMSAINALTKGNPSLAIAGLRRFAKANAGLPGSTVRALAQAYGWDEFTFNALIANMASAGPVNDVNMRKAEQDLAKAHTTKSFTETALNAVTQTFAMGDVATGGAGSQGLQAPLAAAADVAILAGSGLSAASYVRKAWRSRADAAAAARAIHTPNVSGLGNAVKTASKGGRIAGALGSLLSLVGIGAGAAEAVGGGLAAGTAASGGTLIPVLLAALAAAGVGYGVYQAFKSPEQESKSDEGVDQVKSGANSDTSYMREVANNTRALKTNSFNRLLANTGGATQIPNAFFR